MSGLLYAVNVNYVTGGGHGDDNGHRGSVDNAKNKVDDSKENAPKPVPPPLPPPKLLESESELEAQVEPAPEPEPLKADSKDEGAKEGLEGSCSTDSRPPGGAPLPPPKLLESEPEPVVEAQVELAPEPEPPKADSKDEDAKEGLEGSCSIDSRPPGGGMLSNLQPNFCFLLKLKN
jgi:hypothetical protein